MPIPVQTWVGGDEPIQEEFESVSNCDDPPHKPDGGLWTSTSFIRNGHTISDWIQWLERNQQYHESQVVYELKPEKREYDILCIDSYDQLRSVVSRYNRQSKSSSRKSELHGVFPSIDFEAISDEYDAIHLTEKGQSETRLTNPGLYGWDVETYLWFDWVFVDMIDSTPITEVVNDI